MQNSEMKQLLAEGLAIDVSEFPRSSGGEYVLDSYVPSFQYCDAKTETWIVSIACHLASMRLYASTSDDLYQKEGYQCLYLR